MILSTLQILLLLCMPGVGRRSILAAAGVRLPGPRRRAGGAPEQLMLCDARTDAPSCSAAGHAALVQGPPAMEDLPGLLAAAGASMRGPEGERAAITAADVMRHAEMAQGILERAGSSGIGVLSWFDGDFPAALRGTVDARGAADPPVLLYRRGEGRASAMPSIAVVGTRMPTLEGAGAAFRIAAALARAGRCVVSGLALGVDAAAHSGALREGGATAAFLACGADIVYPPRNAGLAEAVLHAGGALLSEYPPGTPVSRFRLVERDRLQAGMSQAVIVVQTGVRGGSMHAANAALAAGKTVLAAVPCDGRQGRDHEQGMRMLLERGAACLRIPDAHAPDSAWDDALAPVLASLPVQPAPDPNSSVRTHGART